jgi:hypothetical protein
LSPTEPEKGFCFSANTAVSVAKTRDFSHSLVRGDDNPPQ